MNAPIPATAFRAADRLGAIGVSEIVRLTQEANQLKRQGQPVIVLGLGEPDFDTPAHILEAAQKAMARGETHYTVLDGTAELKAAIQHKFKHDNGLDFQLNEITAGAGAKQILYNALMASVNPGDEVILPTPYWTTYADMVLIAGGVPVVVPCTEANGFRITPEQLEAAITPRTRWVFINSPSNPSGAAYSAEQLRPVLEVVERHPQVWLLADDIYEHILYDGRAFATPAAVLPSLRDRTLTVNGVSKAYAMTGWRIGYALANPVIIAAMTKIHQYTMLCAPTMAQVAALEAMQKGDEEMVHMRHEYNLRRRMFVSGLNRIGLDCFEPKGAFYAFPSVRSWGLSSEEFAERLLKEQKVAVVPGNVFGQSGEGFLRCSYATSREELIEALDRMEIFLSGF